MNPRIKKKILFVDQSLDAGGAERVMCTIIKSLNPNKFDINLVLLSYKGRLVSLIPDYVKIHDLNCPSTKRSIIRFGRLLQKYRPDVVFATTERSIVLSVLGLLFLFKRYKIIARFPNTIDSKHNPKAKKGWRYFTIKRCMQWCDVIIAQTNFMSTELMNLFGITEKKIRVIPNPIDIEFINDMVLNKKNPMNPNYINIVASGRITRQKGFDNLINAFSLVVTKNKKYRLHILGEDKDNLTSSLNRQAIIYGIQDYITFHGHVDNPFIFYKNCDLFVLSSRWEGLPNVILECKFFGKPIVATKCIPELELILSDKDDAFLVDIGDHISMSNAILEYKKLNKRASVNNTIAELTDIFD